MKASMLVSKTNDAFEGEQYRLGDKRAALRFNLTLPLSYFVFDQAIYAL